jgi:hypothetical protein
VIATENKISYGLGCSSGSESFFFLFLPNFSKIKSFKPIHKYIGRNSLKRLGSFDETIKKTVGSCQQDIFPLTNISDGHESTPSASDVDSIRRIVCSLDLLYLHCTNYHFSSLISISQE